MDCALFGLLVISGIHVARIANMVIAKSIVNSTYINRETMVSIIEYLPYLAIILFIMLVKSALSFITVNFKLKKQDLDDTLGVFTDCSVEENEFGVSIIRSKGMVCGVFVNEDDMLNIKANLRFYFRVRSVYFYSIFVENINTRSFHFASMIMAFILLYTIKFFFIDGIPGINVTAGEVRISVYTISICAAILFGINAAVRNVYCRMLNVYWFLAFFILCDCFIICVFWIIVFAKLGKSSWNFYTDTRIRHPSELPVLL